MLDLEDEVLNVAAVLDLIGQRLALQIEEHTGRSDEERGAGLITLIDRTQKSLRSSYDRAITEWRTLRNAAQNN